MEYSTLRTDKGALCAFLQDHLLHSVMPFWTNNCIDWKNGGISNLVTDEGVRTSDEKYMYSQGRALFTYAALYNEIEQKQEYLDICRCIASLIFKTHRPGGYWPFRVNPDGSVIDDSKSVYLDAYSCVGLCEYAAASGNAQAMDLALEVYDRASPRLENPSTVPAAPLHFPEGTQPHGPIMHSVYAFFLLGTHAGRKDIRERALQLANRAMALHVDPENDLLYEFISPGGGRAPGDYGQTVVTGHAIEAMWFYEEVFSHFGQRDKAKQTQKLIRTHVDFGWDTEYGGLYLAKHVQPGVPPKWHNPDSKSWWPQAETLYALLRAYEVTGDAWYADWFDTFYHYIFTHYPNPVHGEWRHCLDREGRPRGQIATIPVKDPFHMPRVLIKCILSLRRMIEREAEGAGTA